MTAVLVSVSIALVTPVKLVVLVVAHHILASAASILRFPLVTVSLRPRPAADTAVRAMATILIGRFVAPVAPTELMWFEFKDVLLASAEGNLRLPLCTFPRGPRPAADTAVLHPSTVLICVVSALVTPVKLSSLEGVNISLTAASGMR